EDVETPDGFLYDYRSGPIDQPDNRALRAAHQLQVPIVYFVGTRPGWYRPNFPFFVTADDVAAKRVLVTPGAMIGPMDEQEPVLPEDPIERRYVVRETRVRIHQARFRGRVVPAYKEQCAICRLKEVRLLEAAHIVGDLEERGEPSSATDSRCARSIIVRTTTTSSASRRTTKYACLRPCFTTRTGRCSKS